MKKDVNTNVASLLRYLLHSLISSDTDLIHPKGDINNSACDNTWQVVGREVVRYLQVFGFCDVKLSLIR